MKTRIILYADDGKILTNGKIFGKRVFLADNENTSDYYEITDAEYQSISLGQDENINNGVI